MIYGKWPVQANKIQANIYTHMCNEVTFVWVGLAQARPNYSTAVVFRARLWRSQDLGDARA